MVVLDGNRIPYNRCRKCHNAHTAISKMNSRIKKLQARISLVRHRTFNADVLLGDKKQQGETYARVVPI